MGNPINISDMKTDQEMDGKGYVHWKSWQETYAGLMAPQYLERLTLEKCTAWAHQWPQNTLVLKSDDQVIGFSCFGQSQDPASQNVGEVIALYLLAEHQGQGLGLELMKATMDRLADKRQVILWVIENNERAIRFYQGYGFRLDGGDRAEPFGRALRMVFERD